MRRPVGPGPGRTRTLLTASPSRTQATASRPCDRPRHGPKSGHWPARSRRKQVRGVRGSGGIPGTGAGLGPAGGGGVAASVTRWLLDTIGASARWRAEGGRGGAGQGPRLVTYLTQIKPSWSNYFSAWRRAEGGRGGPGARLPPVRAGRIRDAAAARPSRESRLLAPGGSGRAALSRPGVAATVVRSEPPP